LADRLRSPAAFCCNCWKRFEAYTWVRTMLGLGEKAAAHDWLNRTYAIRRELEIDESDIDWLAASFGTVCAAVPQDHRIAKPWWMAHRLMPSISPV
jgi:hypothetical protein